jgi:hypothetical protein
MRLLPANRISRGILTAVAVTVLAVLLYKLYAWNSLRLQYESEARFLGHPTSWWAEGLYHWRLDRQTFVGGRESWSFWSPQWVNPAKPGMIGQEPTDEKDRQVRLLLVGDPDAQPVLLELFQRRNDAIVFELACYGLAVVKNKSPATTTALASAAEDEHYPWVREMIRDITRDLDRKEPAKAVMFGGKETDEQR